MARKKLVAKVDALPDRGKSQKIPWENASPVRVLAERRKGGHELVPSIWEERQNIDGRILHSLRMDGDAAGGQVYPIE